MVSILRGEANSNSNSWLALLRGDTNALVLFSLPSQEQDRLVQEKLAALAEASPCANISRLELAAIKSAMNMGTGHWYLCPNGHPYCIADCGGANQEAICPVPNCRKPIGGMNHALRSGNTRASDIDAIS